MLMREIYVCVVTAEHHSPLERVLQSRDVSYRYDRATATPPVGTMIATPVVEMKPVTFDAAIRAPASAPRRSRCDSERDALDVYLERASRHPRLTVEQERAALVALAELRRLAESSDEDGGVAAQRYLEARNRFVCANLRLVFTIAGRYSKRSMSLTDLVQEGNLGLIKAVDRFDPEHDVRFSTYAVWWIRHAITRSLIQRGRTVRVPANLHVLLTRVRSARAALQGQLGREPTLVELSEWVEVAPAKLRTAMEAMAMRSLPLDPSPGFDGPTWSDRLGVDAPQLAFEERSDQRRNQAIALRAMEQLPERLRDILEHRFALRGQSHMTLEALGHSHEISRERVRQLQNRALDALRTHVESSSVSSLVYT